MKGKKLPNDAAEESLSVALVALGVDLKEAVVYWHKPDLDDYQILVAVPFGLLTYQRAEILGRFNEYATTLTKIAPWRDVKPEIKSDTHYLAASKEYTTLLDVSMEGLPEKGVRVRSGDEDAAGFAEFLGECLRRHAEAL